MIKPGVIDYSIVLSDAQSPEECMSNAKYAITMARMTGAPVYALPEDITEVKHKMVMTVYASLMLADIKSWEESATHEFDIFYIDKSSCLMTLFLN